MTRHLARPGNTSGNSLGMRLHLLSLLTALSMASVSPLAMAQTDDYATVDRLVRAGQLDEALARADQYLTAKPRDPQMRFLRGVIQTEAGKPAEAMLTFRTLTEDFPELPEPYNNLAVLYAGQSQFDNARAALEMAIRTNPNYAIAHENLGDVYAKLASQSYGRALQLDAGNAAAGHKLVLIRNLFSADTKGMRPVGGQPVLSPGRIASEKPVSEPTAVSRSPRAALP